MKAKLIFNLEPLAVGYVKPLSKLLTSSNTEVKIGTIVPTGTPACNSLIDFHTAVPFVSDDVKILSIPGFPKLIFKSRATFASKDICSSFDFVKSHHLPSVIGLSSGTSLTQEDLLSLPITQ